MKRLPLSLAMLACLAVAAVGCASFSSRVFQLERAAASTADASMKSYAVYWQSAKKDPAAFHRTAEGLDSERKEVEALSVKIGTSIELTESLRKSYATNAAVRPALEAAMRTVGENLSNTIATVTRLMK